MKVRPNPQAALVLHHPAADAAAGGQVPLYAIDVEFDVRVADRMIISPSREAFFHCSPSLLVRGSMSTPTLAMATPIRNAGMSSAGMSSPSAVDGPDHAPLHATVNPMTIRATAQPIRMRQ
jgi:hypothetical protein